MSLEVIEVASSEAAISLAISLAVPKLLQTLRHSDAHIVITGGRNGSLIVTALDHGLCLALATNVKEQIGKLHIWLSDERFTALDDPDRLGPKLASLFTLCARFCIFHQIESPSAMDLASAATTYSREIDQSMGRSKFDLTFLSLGEDGHIASLFPGHCEELADKNSALAVNNSPKPPAKRVSISVNRLAASEAIFIFAIGASKKNALANLLAGPVGLLVKSAPLAQISVITDNKNSLKTEQI